MIYKKISKLEYVNLEPASGNFHIISQDGRREWVADRFLHRTDGPAVVSPNGTRIWFLVGSEYSKEEWFSLLTPEQLTIALANPENF